MKDDTFETLHNALVEQSELIAKLQARVERIESERGGRSFSVNTGDKTEYRVAESRRGFLRFAGVAAAGAAVAVVTKPGAAAAADNAAILQGINNTGTLPTTVTNTTGSGPASDIPALKATGGTNSIGLLGEANGTAAAGVSGKSDTGFAVYGSGISGYSMYAGGGGRYGMDPHLTSGSPVTGSYGLGDMFRNSVGDVYICTVAGSGGAAQFRKIAGPQTAGQLHLTTAARIFWTATGGGPFVNGSDQLLSAAGNVPVGATALLATLLAYAVTSDGYLTAYKAGTTNPGTINAFWGNVPNTQIASTTVIPLSPTRDYRLRLTASGAGSAQVAVDLLGYFA